MKRHEYDLLQVCLDLHMSFTHSMDLSPEDQSRYVEALRGRLDSWRPSDSVFDQAVRNLVVSTLMERGLLRVVNDRPKEET